LPESVAPAIGVIPVALGEVLGALGLALSVPTTASLPSPVLLVEQAARLRLASPIAKQMPG
jgi:hypothetical protein